MLALQIKHYEIFLQTNEELDQRIDSWTIYKHYFQSGQCTFYWLLLGCLHILAQIPYSVTGILIGYIVDDKSGNILTSTNFIAFSSLVAILLGLSMIRALMHHMLCLQSSKGLHNKMFAKILFAPSRFFDINPVGRILNRFSKDLGTIDELLPQVLYDVTLTFVLTLF